MTTTVKNKRNTKVKFPRTTLIYEILAEDLTPLSERMQFMWEHAKEEIEEYDMLECEFRIVIKRFKPDTPIKRKPELKVIKL